MSDAKPHTKEEIEDIRAELSSSNKDYTSDDTMESRWLATVDAKDAEIERQNAYIEDLIEKQFAVQAALDMRCVDNQNKVGCSDLRGTEAEFAKTVREERDAGRAEIAALKARLETIAYDAALAGIKERWSNYADAMEGNPTPTHEQQAEAVVAQMRLDGAFDLRPAAPAAKDDATSGRGG